MVINPDDWLIECTTIQCRQDDGRTTESVTPWFNGRTHPAQVGWYERQFTDGLFRHWWSGNAWLSKIDGQAHWRQVGDYPIW